MDIRFLTLAAVLPFITMAKNAGATVSGHRLPGPDEEAATAK